LRAAGRTRPPYFFLSVRLNRILSATTTGLARLLNGTRRFNACGIDVSDESESATGMTTQSLPRCQQLLVFLLSHRPPPLYLVMFGVVCLPQCFEQQQASRKISTCKLK
jgi:hypothetical protein